jgi:hypothetical protein
METLGPVVIDQSTMSEVERLESWTKSIVITNGDERTSVYNAVKTVKNTRARIVDFFRDSKEKSYAAWKAIVANEKSFTDSIDAFEAAGKGAIITYDKEQERIRQNEQRRLQAIADEQARKERERAEAEYYRQRRIEEAAKRKADEARRAAEEADASERSKLLLDAETAERKAAAASAKAEEKAEMAAAVVATVVTVAPVAVRQDGESVRKTWKGKILNAKEIPLEYLAMWIDQKKVDDFAKATKGSVKIKGIEIYSEESLSIKR